jgi:hypothetical protein
MRNVERLTDLAVKCKASQKLTELLTKGLDVNRMLIYLNRFKSIDALETAMTKMAQADNVMFTKTITIQGKTMNLADFMVKYVDDAASVYYKEAGNTLSIIKYFNTQKQGVEMVIKYSGEKVLDVEGRVITEMVLGYTKEED